jgi:hypothetical protein
MDCAELPAHWQQHLITLHAPRRLLIHLMLLGVVVGVMPRRQAGDGRGCSRQRGRYGGASLMACRAGSSAEIHLLLLLLQGRVCQQAMLLLVVEAHG